MNSEKKGLIVALLLDTDIDVKVNRELKGLLGRIGGRVEQLYKYYDCVVEDINIVNQQSAKYGKSLIGSIRYGYDLLEQEVRFWRKGYWAVRDRKSFFFDIHEAFNRPEFHNKYDGILSSNVVEHSHNTIWFFLNMHFILKDEGYQYHAIPYCKYTFDCYRQPTELGHFIEDFENMVDMDDYKEHAEDYFQSAIKSGWEKQRYDIKYPGLHYHVFDEMNIKQLLEYMFEDVMVDIIKTEKYSDVLVLFRNTLKKSFKEKSSRKIDEYFSG